MIIQLNLQDAVSKVFGHSLVKSGTPVTQWQLFQPYSTHSKSSQALLMLLEVPKNLYTSQQICDQRISKFGDVLHKVKFIFIERCFQSSYYLLIAQQNLLPINSLLKIKRQSKEIINEKIIYDYIQFTNKLLDHPMSNQITFNQNQIGINSQGKFYLANYLLYFQNQQKMVTNRNKKIQKSSNKNLKNDIKLVLAKMLTPQVQNINFKQFYSITEQKYGKNMRQIVEKCMQSSSSLSQINSLITNLKSESLDQSFSAATVTDSCGQDCEKISQALMNQSCSISPNDLSGSRFKKDKNSVKRRNTFLCFFFFVIILLGAGAITFTYLNTNSQFSCKPEQHKYQDEQTKACLDCDTSCQECKNGGNNMCTRCKGNQFLIINSQNDQVGRCGDDCHGRKIKPKICVIDY